MKKDATDELYVKNVEKKRYGAVKAMERVRHFMDSLLKKCPTDGPGFYAKIRHKSDTSWMLFNCKKDENGTIFITTSKCNKKEVKKDLINQDLGDEFNSLQTRMGHITKCLDMCDVVLLDYVSYRYDRICYGKKNPTVVKLCLNDREYVCVYDPFLDRFRLLISPESTLYEEIIE